MRRNIFAVFLAVFGAGCGSGGSNLDAQAGGNDAAEQEAAGPPLPYCTAKPAQASVTDLSGTWVARVSGALIVNAPIVGAIHTQTVLHLLVTVSQNGTNVVMDGHYCDRAEIDPPGALVPVVIPDAWAHTEKPMHRTGTFAPGADGIPVLTLPRYVEIAGAELVSPEDPLPTVVDDPPRLDPPRVIDEDHDGNPGITVRLSGQSFAGSIYSVQKQITSISAIVVAPDRVEGALTFSSTQNILASDPSTIAALYSQSTTSPDYVTCNSGFVMVKIADATVVDGGAVGGGAVDGGDAVDASNGSALGCEWVRAHEATLFP